VVGTRTTQDRSIAQKIRISIPSDEISEGMDSSDDTDDLANSSEKGIDSSGDTNNLASSSGPSQQEVSSEGEDGRRRRLSSVETHRAMDLVIATLVDETDVVFGTLIEEAAQTTQLGKSVYCKRWFIALVKFLCIGGLFAGVSFAIPHKKRSDVVTLSTLAPTFLPTSAEEQLLSWLMLDKNISRETINTSQIAFEMAVKWYANEDRARHIWLNESKDAFNFDRFLLAWLYYALSSNGNNPWESCNPPNNNVGESKP
jgi:hypothetical protein